MTTNQFTAKFNSYSTYLKAFALKLTKDPFRAEDLFQETAFKAFRHQAKFTADVNMKAWLTTIMKNAFLNEFRKKYRKMEVSDNSDGMARLYSLSNSTNNRGEGKIMLDEISDLIEDLEYGLKKPFVMAFQGYKYEEISETMNLPLGTIKSRIFMARKALKEDIKKLYNANCTVDMAA